MNGYNRKYSAANDERSQRLRSAKKFQEKLDEDSRKPFVNIVLVGQEDGELYILIYLNMIKI